MSALSLCLGPASTRPLQHSGETWHVKWRSGRLRGWTLVNMEMMLEIYFERLGSCSLIKGMLIKKMCVCVYICSTLCQLYCCWPRGGKEFNTGKGMFNVFKSKRNMVKPWFFDGKTMPPSFHVHNSKCDNPTLAQHQRGGLSFHAFWASRVSPAFSLMREIWWNAPTINHSNQRNQELIEPKDQPQNQTQKSQPPNHPNAQTLPCPSQCCQWQSQCKVLTWSRWKRAVAPVVARRNAPKKKKLKRGGFLSCSFAIQSKNRPSNAPAPVPWWLVARGVTVKDPLLPPETSRNHKGGLHGGKSWNHLVTRVVLRLVEGRLIQRLAELVEVALEVGWG